MEYYNIVFVVCIAEVALVDLKMPSTVTNKLALLLRWLKTGHRPEERFVRRPICMHKPEVVMTPQPTT